MRVALGLLVLLCVAPARGQQNPAYDTSAHTWSQGLTTHTAGSAARNLSDADADWLGFLMPLGTAPQTGTITISELYAVVRDTDTSGTDEWQAAELFVYSGPSGTTFTKVASVALTDIPDAAGTNTLYNKTGLSLSVSVTAGTQYWWGFGMRGRASHGASKPSIRAGHASTPNVGYWFTSAGVPAGGDGYMPSTIDTSAITPGGSPGSSGQHALARIVYTTTIRQPFVVSASAFSNTTVSYVMPRRTDGNWWVIAGNVSVTDADAVSVALARDDQASGVSNSILATADFGVADQMTFDTDAVTAANVPLSATEAADNIDMGILVRPATTRTDLFYCNKTTGGGLSTTDYITECHTSQVLTKHQTNGVAYTNAPDWVTISRTGSAGTDTVASLRVASRLVVYLGDSMLGASNYTGGAEPGLNRLSRYFHAYLSNPLPAWNNARANKELSDDLIQISDSQSAEWKLYKHPTAGSGDISDMHSILLVNHGGNNDMTSIPDAPERNAVLAENAQLLSFMVSDARRTTARRWSRSTAYALGDVVQPQTPTAYVYRCTTAGTTGTSQPTFSTTEGATTADNTAVWTTQLADRDNDIMLFGTIEYNAGGASAVQQAAFAMWEDIRAAIGVAAGASVCRYRDVITYSRSQYGIGSINSIQDSDGIHLTQPETNGGAQVVIGAQIVARAAVQAYETNYQGTRTPGQSVGSALSGVGQ